MASSVNRSRVGEYSIERRWFCPLPLVVLAVLTLSSGAAVLGQPYLPQTCSQLQSIVQSGMQAAFSNDVRIGASILRLFFHDCIVGGCDASILLQDTPTFTGEQNSLANANSARGYNIINSIKAQVESQCPGEVSCADILALAARDGVTLAGGPSWFVQLGRYDSLTASQAAANAAIPAPFDNLQSLVNSFQNAGLSFSDVVALSGAHTFGRAKCSSVDVNGNSRLYNWSPNSDLTSGTGKPDPNMDPGFLASLQAACPQNQNSNNLNNLDLTTPNTFDNAYYQNLVARKGLLNSDEVLWENPSTRAIVQTYAQFPSTWSGAFVGSITKMGLLNWKNAGNGEIRKQCAFPNS